MEMNDEERIKNAMWYQAVAVIVDMGGIVFKKEDLFEKEQELEWKPKDTVPTKWQPIETAPKDNTDILGWSKDTDIVQQVYWHIHHKMWVVAFFEDCTPSAPPTHWMPLPEPPKVKNGNS